MARGRVELPSTDRKGWRRQRGQLKSGHTEPEMSARHLKEMM